MPIVSVSEPFNIPALGGNPAPSGASKLIELTDVSAGASNPGAVLTELAPVAGVRQFGLVAAQSGGGTDFVMREWDMSPVLQTPAWTLGDGSGMTQDAGPPAQQLLAPNGQPLAIAAGPGGQSFAHTRAAIALSALELPLMLTLDPVGTGQAALAFLPATVAVFDVLFGVATSVNPALFFGDTGSGLTGSVMQAGGYAPLDAAAFAGDKLTVTITAAGADYVIGIAGTDYAVSGSNNPILSIVAPDVGTGPVSIGVQVLGAASLPAGHVDGYIYQVSHAGSFGGKSTVAGDFVYPYDQNGLVIIRLPVNSQISKLIDLTDVNAGTSSNPGAVLTELTPVGGVRRFGFNVPQTPDVTDTVNNAVDAKLEPYKSLQWRKRPDALLWSSNEPITTSMVARDNYFLYQGDYNQVDGNFPNGVLIYYHPDGFLMNAPWIGGEIDVYDLAYNHYEGKYISTGLIENGGSGWIKSDSRLTLTSADCWDYPYGGVELKIICSSSVAAMQYIKNLHIECDGNIDNIAISAVNTNRASDYDITLRASVACNVALFRGSVISISYGSTPTINHMPMLVNGTGVTNSDGKPVISLAAGEIVRVKIQDFSGVDYTKASFIGSNAVAIMTVERFG